MSPLLRAVSFSTFALALAACGDNQDPAGADAFWDKIHDEDYASKWASPPGYAMRTPSSAAHGDEVIIYINDTVQATLAGGAGLSTWPEGSLIVKEGYDGESIHAIAAMEKRSGAWYWAEWSGDGVAKYSGSPDICTSCHESGSDYVRAFSLPK
ncbi:MAG: hypothetical protein U0359_14445 [Byssovorax sp.]